MTPCHRFACLTGIYLVTFLALPPGSAQVPDFLLHSLFDPSTNAQASMWQGSSVAADSFIVVAALPHDDASSIDSGVVRIYIPSQPVAHTSLSSPTGDSDDRFGSAVATSGTRVVVGAEEGVVGGIEAGCVYVYDLTTSQPYAPVVTLTNPRPEAFDRFGHAVAIDGTRLVVGANGATYGFASVGVVYVFELNSATPNQPVATLTNPTPAQLDLFGYSVAISGTRVVVGALGDDTGAANAGSAYVFDLAGLTPEIPVTVLHNPSPEAEDNFGRSVALFGARVVVGAPYDNSVGPNMGSAYVYDLDSTGPAAPAATLNHSSSEEDGGFGAAVAISGTRVVVGASGGTRGGSACVFDVATANPSVAVTTLNNPGPPALDDFGASVAIAGSRVVVGAPYDDTGARDAGTVYVYDIGSATPMAIIATLNNYTAVAFDQFGSSVAVSGTRVVVGSPFDDTGAEDAGSVYVYDLVSTTPSVPILRLHNPAPTPRDRFGHSVSISGQQVVVGTIGPNPGVANPGRAHVYNLASATPGVPMLTLGNQSPDGFGISVAISGNRVVIGAPENVNGLAVAGAAFVYDLSSVAPTIPVLTLTNPSPGWYDRFGISVSMSGTRVVVGANQDNAGKGSASVYDLSGLTPTIPVATLTNPVAGPGAFGWTVGISGTWVAVGAPLRNYREKAGVAHIYDLTSNTPMVPVSILENPSTNGTFGWSLGMSGTRVVVGTLGGNKAYLFDLVGITRTAPAATFSNPGPTSQDSFGVCVAMDETTIIAGAPGNDIANIDSGSAYIFGLAPALSLVSSNPGLATLSWAPTTSGLVLQYTDSLANPNWLYASSGDRNPVIITTTNTARFYRLLRP